LDETLVHCSLDPIPNPDLTFQVPFDGVSYEVHVRKRPCFEQFLAEVSKVFEVVVFTASQRVGQTFSLLTTVQVLTFVS
jgi:CTD small phosphatase-like protein 2